MPSYSDIVNKWAIKEKEQKKENMDHYLSFVRTFVKRNNNVLSKIEGGYDAELIYDLMNCHTVTKQYHQSMLMLMDEQDIITHISSVM